MGYIKEEKQFDGDGNRIGKKITITGSPPWKMWVWKVKEDGNRLPYWRANNDDDLKEWIYSVIDDGELNDVLDFIITENGIDKETIKEYCQRNGISV